MADFRHYRLPLPLKREGGTPKRGPLSLSAFSPRTTGNDKRSSSMTTEPLRNPDPYTIYVNPGETIAAAFARGRRLALSSRQAVILSI